MKQPLGISLLVLICAPAAAPAADVARGGRLYDAWWIEIGAPAPEGEHPLYPEAGRQSGSTTFRCKECHGWDYKGVDGAYGSGSHFTGIRGVLGSALSAEEMIEIIRNPPGDGSAGTTVNGHGFGDLGLSDDRIRILVEFLRTQLVDTDDFIETDGTFRGDASRGKLDYGDACVGCHGDDGTWINFGTAEEPEWVGTVAVENPWEFLHKTRFGQPGSVPQMPSWTESGGSNEGAAGIGRYAQQSLPTGRETSEGRQLPGDSNQDGSLDISDAISLLGYLFLGSPERLPCEEQGGDGPSKADVTLLDGDGDGKVTLTDAVRVFQFLFGGGETPGFCVDDRCSECAPIEGCPDVASACRG